MTSKSDGDDLEDESLMPILQAEHPQRSLAIDSIINILFEVYSRVKTLEVIDQKAIETPPIIKIELPEYQKVL